MDPHGADHGTYVLHKFAKRIGQETWQRKADSSGNVIVTSDFLFTDRGTAVPLKTVYTASADYEPTSLIPPMSRRS